jgi:hypothetical protein
MTSRVEWTVLSGDDVEALLAVLVYSRHTRALRVRPSQGDGGRDISVPVDGQPGLVDIYQVKKFASNLTSNQKTQIDHSYFRLLNLIAQSKVSVRNWYLLMPLDPTPENLTWFAQITTRAADHFEMVLAKPEDFPKESVTRQGLDRIVAWQKDPETSVEWKGLVACEALAAEFPNVVDYLLHGGRERLETAVGQMVTLLSTDRDLAGAKDGPAVQPADLRDHLHLIQDVLDTDPHFVYGVSFDPHRPILVPEPGLIAATQETGSDGRTLTFKIFERFREALNERPVPITLDFAFDGGSEDADAYEDWQRYGTPAVLPADFKIDLPGGLGGLLKSATIAVGPSAQARPFPLRLRIVTPGGSEVARLSLNMEPPAASPDGLGAWSRGTDATKSVLVESRLDSRDSTGKFNIEFGDTTGTPVDAASDAIHFFSHWSAGNRVESSGAHGPFIPVLELPADIEPPVGPLIVRIAEALVAIQTRTHEPLLMPDPATLTVEDVRDLFRASALVQGRSIVGTWTEAPLYPGDDYVPELEGEFQYEIFENLMVDVGDAKVFLGVAALRLESVNVELNDGQYVLRPCRNNSATRTLDTSALPLESELPPVRSQPVLSNEADSRDGDAL